MSEETFWTALGVAMSVISVVAAGVSIWLGMALQAGFFDAGVVVVVVVIDAHHGVSPREQAQCEGGSDEAGGAGDEDSHNARAACVLSVLFRMADFLAQLRNFLLEAVVFREFTLQEADREARLLLDPCGCERIEVAQLLVAFAEVRHLDPAFVDERTEAVVHLTKADVEFARQGTLTQAGVVFERAQKMQAVFI